MRVEQNAHAEAIEEFYTEYASTQENQAAPCVGYEILLKDERRTRTRARSVTSSCVRPLFVHGDRVVIRWIFHWMDGPATDMEGPVSQRWEGERVTEEQFSYDPVQRAPKKA